VRNLVRATELPHEVTYGSTPSVIYGEGEDGVHGNFHAASFRRIAANPTWLRRLDKAYTASRRVARSPDRRRGELECANSSDALLMNIFCYPGLLHRPGVCRLLGIDRGLRPEFGYRAEVPFAVKGTDRTEIDMRLGSCLFEAKLTETGFQQARRSLGGAVPRSGRSLRGREFAAFRRPVRVLPADPRDPGSGGPRRAWGTIHSALRWAPGRSWRALVRCAAGRAELRSAQPAFGADLAGAGGRGTPRAAAISPAEVRHSRGGLMTGIMPQEREFMCAKGRWRRFQGFAEVCSHP